MKKNLLILLALLVAGYNYSFAQTLTLADTDGNEIANGDELVVSGLPEDFEVVAHAHVTNTTGDDVDVLVNSYINEYADGMQFALCWGTCLVPSTHNQTASNAITIAANSTDENSFSGHCYPNETTGIGEVRYKFYVESNPDDSISVTVVYEVGTVGLPQVAEGQLFSEPYPNPANDVITFSYENERIGDTRISIYNAIGVKVKSVRLNQNTNHVQMNTSDLASGVYFYSIVSDNRLVKSSKLIIRH